MNFNLFNSLILAGVIQGFVFALIWLFSKKYRAKSTYFLIALIIVYSLSNLQYYLLDTGIISRREFYGYLSFPFPLLMSALFWFFGLTFLNPEKKISLGEKLLFLPFIIGLILGFIYKYNLLVLGNELDYTPFFASLHQNLEFAGMIFTVIILVLLFLKILRFEKKQTYSPKKLLLRLNWLKSTIIVLTLSTALWAYLEATYVYGTDDSYFYPLWIFVAIITYWFGHIGIYKYGLNEERKNIRKVARDRYSVSEVIPQQNEHIQKMTQFLKVDRNFLNPNITLDSVANELNLSSGHLSKIINTDMGTSFKDYVNKLRVEEAKRYLTDPDFVNYTLVAIGLEAGFNSKSAFNASFKKITGMTPSQFKAQHTN
ncbi:MAG: helix-turn-helix transcriptional regulator [Flavobacteriaceae bacterium]|nr:helix-turn-helix transcriptional regulator [Flavobacteriaceae bacterium]